MTTLAEELEAGDLVEDVYRSLKCAAQFSACEIHENGQWCGELKSNTSITAEYITLLYAIGESFPDPNLWISWLLSEQHVDGSWALAPDIPGDISVTVETYLALRILGVDCQHPALRKAKDFALCSGGVARVRMSTRILLATFGLFPWSAVPELAPELALISPTNPLSVCQMASWARGTVIPLLLIRHHRPVFALPNGRSESNTFLDELWCDPARKQVPYSTSLWTPWKTDPISLIFVAIDSLLHSVDGMRGFWWRAGARKACVSWILENLDQRNWGNIFHPMHVGVLALVLEGFAVDSPPVSRGLDALDTLIWTSQSGRRIQPSCSPVRDTIFMVTALLESGIVIDNGIDLAQSINWIMTQQHIRTPEKTNTPNLDLKLIEGGFSFGKSSKCAPDIGDTATAVLAITKQNPNTISSVRMHLALRWILGMQNSDGGWGTLDHENNRMFLNKTPFSDMNNLCDPSTADVTGRVLETFGRVMHQHDISADTGSENTMLAPELYNCIAKSGRRAVAYLVSKQEKAGPWFGRWGANYVYGTSVVLCALAQFSPSLPPPGCCALLWGSNKVETSITAGTEWLVSVQNSDGGWGESLLTYHDPELAGQGTVSTASQTSWALMGLLASLSPDHPAVVRGVRYLIKAQQPMGARGGSWSERLYTGTAFPKHLFLGYSLSPHYFPMMALGRYVSSVMERKGEKVRT